MNKKIPLFLLCLTMHTAHGMVQEVPGAVGVVDGRVIIFDKSAVKSEGVPTIREWRDDGAHVDIAKGWFYKLLDNAVVIRDASDGGAQTITQFRRTEDGAWSKEGEGQTFSRAVHSPDGKIVASLLVPNSPVIQFAVWSSRGTLDQKLREVTDNNHIYENVFFSPDSKRALATIAPGPMQDDTFGSAYQLFTIDGENDDHVSHVKTVPCDSRISSAAFSPNGKSYVLRYDGGYKISANGKCSIKKYDECWPFWFSPDSKVALAVLKNNTVRVYEGLDTENPYQATEISFNGCRWGLFSPDSQSILLASLAKMALYKKQGTTWQETAHRGISEYYKSGHDCNRPELKFSPDGSKIVVAHVDMGFDGAGNTLVVYNKDLEKMWSQKFDSIGRTNWLLDGRLQIQDHLITMPTEKQEEPEEEKPEVGASSQPPVTTSTTREFDHGDTGECVIS